MPSKGRRGGRGSSSAAAASSASKEQAPIRIKVTSIGDGAVGKSCIIKRYCEGRFVKKYVSTIGVDFGVKPVSVGETTVKVNFWDLSGQPEFFEVRNEFYKDTQGAILVYDCTSRSSFKAVCHFSPSALKDVSQALTVLRFRFFGFRLARCTSLFF